MRDILENHSDSGDEHQISVDENEETSHTSVLTKKKKKKKPGIVYLSAIPKYMTASYLRDLFSNYGEVGRVYLQEDAKDVAKTGKKKNKKLHTRNYAEGWVEFKSKRIAKEVAQVLNNTQIGGRKKSKFYDSIWTIKYLPRFKWTHLSERLSYEQAVRKQRMRTEIFQAKKEADYFSLNVDKSEKLKKKIAKGQKMVNYDISQIEIRQRETVDQILKKRKKHSEDGKARSKHSSGNTKEDDRDDFLKSLFS